MALSYTAELYDRTAFANLLQFFPEDARKQILTSVHHIEELYTHDRHFDLVDAVKTLLSIISEVENDMAKGSLSIDSSSSTTNDLTASASNNAGGAPSGSSVEASPKEVAMTSLSAGLLAAFLESTPMYTIALEKTAECQRLSDDIADHTTWTPTTSIDEKGYGTYYRAEVGKTAHSFKVIGEVKESILHVVSVIMELDLYTEWFPFCCGAEMQGEMTRFHKSSRFVVQVPWPMSNREVFLVGYGVDDLTSRKRVVITSRSIADDEELHSSIRRPPVGKKCTRIKVEVGGFLLEALDPSTCRVSFIMNVDPEIPAVPTFLVNWVSGKMIWVLLHQMDKAAKRAGKRKSKYTERRANRPDIYQHLMRRAVEVYAQHFPGVPVPALDKED